jgi:hypothetical protein
MGSTARAAGAPPAAALPAMHQAAAADSSEPFVNTGQLAAPATILKP